MSNEIVKVNNQLSFAELKESAQVMADSKLFPQWETPQKMMSLMLLCRAEGSDPITAVNRYDNIKGKIAKKPIAMLEDFISDGGKVEYLESTDKVCKIQFTCPNGIEHVEEYNMNDVVKAGNQNKDNYRKYPKQMLRARCISSALRAIYPKSTGAVYTPDELEDSKPEPKQANKVEITPEERENLETAMFETKEAEIVEEEPKVDWDSTLKELVETYTLENLVGYLSHIGFIETRIDELQEGHKERIMTSPSFTACIEKWIRENK